MKVIEVGPRDGLQNEPNTIPTNAKVAFVDALSATGVSEVEVSSFVSPKWVPQLADAEDVFARITRPESVIFSALVPNERGLERAEACGIDKVSLFTGASETFNRKNINASTDESIERFRPVVAATDLTTRAYISTAFWCPFEGRIDPDAVVRVAARLIDLGVDELSVADTIGKASPADVRALLDRLMPVPVPIALHFHDTYGMAIANALTAWKEYEIEAFDASAGGLGGCPYAPGASGNVATEDLVFALKASGAALDMTPCDFVDAARIVEPHLGHPIESHLSKACPKT